MFWPKKAAPRMHRGAILTHYTKDLGETTIPSFCQLLANYLLVFESILILLRHNIPFMPYGVS